MLSVLITTLTLCLSSAHAEGEVKLVEVAEYSAYFVTSVYSSVFLHELGHALAVRAAGGHVDHISLSWHGGQTYFSLRGLSNDELNFISLAGAGMNRLNVGWSGFLLEQTTANNMWTRLGGNFYLINRFMIGFLWIQGLFEENDFRASRDLWTENANGRDAIYALYGALIALDIWWSLPEIRNNYARWMGESPTRNAHASWKVYLSPVGLAAVHHF